MPSLIVIPDVEATGFDAMKRINGPTDSRLVHLGDRAHIEIGALTGGMASGAPSVAFCFELPDGQVVIAETSMALFLTAGDALKARYGDPRFPPGQNGDDE